MAYITKIKVRTYECDSYNHVNNAVYLNYLEHGRMDFLRQVGFDYKAIVAAGYHMYVTEITIKYKASAFLDDELQIEVKPTKMKKISGEFSQTITKVDGTVCAEAKVCWACIDATSGRPCRMPEEFMVEGLLPQE